MNLMKYSLALLEQIKLTVENQINTDNIYQGVNRNELNELLSDLEKAIDRKEKKKEVEKYDKPFIELLVEGEVDKDDIEKFISHWSVISDKALGDYLGFTDKEFKKWHKESTSLDEIVEKRKQNKPPTR